MSRSIKTKGAHEQGGIHAADGYARATGKTGVVLATSGPGATNLVTGIATAYLDSLPLVIITGNVPTDLMGQDNFQEVGVFSLTYGIVKHSYRVARVEKLANDIREAYALAASGRPGPVLIECIVNQDNLVYPMVPTNKSIDEIILQGGR